MLRLDGIGYRYAGYARRVLQDIDLTLADGEIVGVVGEHELYRGMLKQTDLGRSDPHAMVGQ